MYDKFSEDGHGLMANAHKAALRIGHNYIGPEHMLIGLAEMPESRGVALLKQLGVDSREVAATVMSALDTGETKDGEPQLPFTPGAKEVLEFTVDEAQRMGHGSVGTAHLLLGLVRAKGSAAGRALEQAGVDLEAARAIVRDGR